MKNPAIIFALALALGVGSAAITSSLLMAPQGVPQQSEHAFGEEPGDGPAVSLSEDEFLDRLQELREQNADLRDRLMALEQSSGTNLRKPVGEAVTRAEFEAFKREVRAFLDTSLAYSPESKEFKSQLTDLMDSIRKDEAVEKFQAMQAKDSARLEERVAQWDEWLSFNEYQRGEFRVILSAKDMQDAEVLRLWSEGAGDEVVGEAKRTNQEQYQAAIATLLTPQQLEIYRERYADGGRGGGKD